MTEDAKTIRKAMAHVEAMDKARNFPDGTCPASRHVAIMADCLAFNAEYSMLDSEPRHCAISLASVVKSLWEARAEIARLKGESK